MAPLLPILLLLTPTPQCGPGEPLKLMAPDPRAGDYLGTSVAIEGDDLATGAPERKVNGSYSAGRAYFWRRSGGNWSFLQAITPGASVAFVYGLHPGSYVVPPPTCTGVLLAVAPPFLAGAPTILRDDDGDGVVTLVASADGFCFAPLRVQAVDLATCLASNPLDL